MKNKVPVRYTPYNLLQVAEERGMNETELCRELGINTGSFSRWKRGLIPPPDPRRKNNKKFYRKLAAFLDRSMAEVLAGVVFPLDGEDERELARYAVGIIESGAKSGAGLLNYQPSEKSLREGWLMSVNLEGPGREEFYAVLIPMLKAYVTQVLKQEWIEDPVRACAHFARLRHAREQGVNK